MRVLVSPDCFTGTLSALEASEAIRAGWLHTNPNDDVSVLPVCDGGPGFLDVAVNAFNASRVPVIVRDPLGREIPAEFAIAPALARIAGVEIVVVTDVDNPLLGGRGATATYAPQKGATEELVMRLEVSLRDFAQLLGKRGDGKDAAVALGAGSGGGLGYGLIHLGAVRESGIDYVMQAVGLDKQISESDLVITGEGCLDDQSLRGKVVPGVAAAVSAVGKPCIVLAGEVRLGKRECASAGIDAAYSMKELFGAEAAFNEPAQTLQAMASRVAKTWGRA
ncbi:MAG: hypothetical protein EBS15_01155 [Actinobacteria bacterium]|nr:hypothetical protein [Actinomycetota bacterium]